MSNKKKRRLPKFTKKMLIKAIGKFQVAMFQRKKNFIFKITAKNTGKTFVEIIIILYLFCNDKRFNSIWLRRKLNETTLIFEELTKVIGYLKKTVGLDLSSWIKYDSTKEQGVRKIYWHDYFGSHAENRFILLGSFEHYNKVTGQGCGYGYYGRISVEEPVPLEVSDAVDRNINKGFMTNLWAMYDTFSRTQQTFKKIMTRIVLCLMANNWDQNHSAIKLINENLPEDRDALRNQHYQFAIKTIEKWNCHFYRASKLMNPSIDKQLALRIMPGESKEFYLARVYGFGYEPPTEKRYYLRSALANHQKPVPGDAIKTAIGIDWGVGDKTAVCFGRVIRPWDGSKPFIEVTTGKEWDNKKRKKEGKKPLPSRFLMPKIEEKIIEFENEFKSNDDPKVRIAADPAGKQLVLDFKDYIAQKNYAMPWIVRKAKKQPLEKWGIFDRTNYLVVKIGNGELRFSSKMAKTLFPIFRESFVITGKNDDKRYEQGMDMDMWNAMEYFIPMLKKCLRSEIKLWQMSQ